jgi:hypothetical protein
LGFGVWGLKTLTAWELYLHALIGFKDTFLVKRKQQNQGSLPVFAGFCCCVVVALLLHPWELYLHALIGFKDTFLVKRK